MTKSNRGMFKMTKRAVILSGGKGTRLKPYTVVLPKPLMPIGDYPILEVVVRQLAKSGFGHITMAVNHQADIIQAFFGDGRKRGVRIDYSIEDKPLGTMGPLRLIKDLPDNFLVMNGDILTDLDYAEFYRYHIGCKSVFTVASFVREVKSEYGILEISNENRLTGFREKPIVKHEVSMGVYMASSKILEYIPKDKPYGFDSLMADLIGTNRPAAVYRHNSYWLDIGNPSDYSKAIEEFENRREAFLKE